MMRLTPHKPTCYVFQHAGMLGVDRRRLCTCDDVKFGSQAKYEHARNLRNARKKAYEHSPVRPHNTGYRFLTEKELDAWYVRLAQNIQKRGRSQG